MENLGEFDRKYAAEPSDGAVLFQRIGGMKAIETIVSRLYERILVDERINHFFADTDMERLSELQKLWILCALGIEQGYSGRTIAQAHDRLGVGLDHLMLWLGHVVNIMERMEIETPVISDFGDMLLDYWQEEIFKGSAITQGAPE